MGTHLDMPLREAPLTNSGYSIENNLKYLERTRQYNSLRGLIYSHARSRGDSIAFSEWLSPTKPERITFSELARRVKILSDHLASHIEATGPARIAVIPANTINSIITIFSIICSGSDAVLINPNQSKDRLREQIAYSESSLTIKEDRYFDHIGQTISELFDAAGSSAACASSAKTSREGGVMLFTTGTTGSSKLVQLSISNLISNSLAMMMHHRIQPADVILTPLPIYYANALGIVALGCMVSGAEGAILNEYDPFNFLATAVSANASIINVVPPILESLSDMPRPVFPPRLRHFLTAAAPLHQRTLNRIFEQSGRRVIQGYGLTETTNFSTCCPLDLSDADYSDLILSAEIPPVGHSIFGTSVSVLNEDGEVCPFDVEGQVCVRGNNIMKGYFSNQQETDKSFKYGWFNTGDIGRLTKIENSSTAFLTLTGRIKNIAKVRGQAVSLEELERFIMALPEIKDVVVCSKPDIRIGDALLCYIEGSNNCIQLEYLNQLLKSRFGRGIEFEEVRFIDRIPRLPNGKVNRQTLI